MTVEREIAGFAIPFAVGTAAAVYTGISSGNIFAFSLIIAGTAIPWMLLMSPARKKWSSTLVRCIIASIALGSGALCGMRENETFISDLPDKRLSSSVLNYGETLEKAAESIPFRDRQTNAFVKAVLTGERNGMSDEVTESFRDSGASHILALSGLHLGVIYMMICRLLSFIGFSPTALRFRSMATVFLCGFYTLATGAGPSLVRAFIFIALNEIARLSGRLRSTGYILMSALIIQLCISPSSVRFAGFQLSYAAMAGIAFIYPWLKKLWPSEQDRYSVSNLAIVRPTRWIWNSAAMSIACQITTAPIAWLYFGTFPQYFLLTNLIALPLTSILIPVSTVTLILYKTRICPDLLIRITEWLTGMLIRALEIIASM